MAYFQEEHDRFAGSDPFSSYISATNGAVGPTGKKKPAGRDYDVSPCFDKTLKCEDGRYITSRCCLNDEGGYDCSPTCESDWLEPPTKSIIGQY